MTPPARVSPPRSERELRARARDLAGLSLAEIARARGWPVPGSSRTGKGWPGQLLENALGASAASLPEPDFQLIGVELKTIPIDARGRPRESTYVCSVPLDGAASPRWEDSSVRRKLARVLWVPLLREDGSGIGERRVGSPLLWSPNAAEEEALRSDWEEIMDLVFLGRVDEISAHFGTCLQVRPKAASARSRRWATGATGARTRTLPRGFYLRAAFTAALLESAWLVSRRDAAARPPAS